MTRVLLPGAADHNRMRKNRLTAAETPRTHASAADQPCVSEPWPKRRPRDRPRSAILTPTTQLSELVQQIPAGDERRQRYWGSRSSNRRRFIESSQLKVQAHLSSPQGVTDGFMREKSTVRREGQQQRSRPASAPLGQATGREFPRRGSTSTSGSVSSRLRPQQRSYAQPRTRAELLGLRRVRDGYVTTRSSASRQQVVETDFSSRRRPQSAAPRTRQSAVAGPPSESAPSPKWPVRRSAVTPRTPVVESPRSGGGPIPGLSTDVASFAVAHSIARDPSGSIISASETASPSNLVKGALLKRDPPSPEEVRLAKQSWRKASFRPRYKHVEGVLAPPGANAIICEDELAGMFVGRLRNGDEAGRSSTGSAAAPRKGRSHGEQIRTVSRGDMFAPRSQRIGEQFKQQIKQQRLSPRRPRLASETETDAASDGDPEPRSRLISSGSSSDRESTDGDTEHLDWDRLHCHVRRVRWQELRNIVDHLQHRSLIADTVLDKLDGRRERVLDARLRDSSTLSTTFNGATRRAAAAGISVKRETFVSSMIRHIKIDPFSLSPSLTRFVDSFLKDDDSGAVDLRQLRCTFRVLEQPGERAVEKVKAWFEIYGCNAAIRSKLWGRRVRRVVPRELILEILQTPCESKEEADQIAYLAHELYATIGIPVPRFVESAAFASAVERCPKLMEALSRLFFKRMKPGMRAMTLQSIKTQVEKKITSDDKLRRRAQKMFSLFSCGSMSWPSAVIRRCITTLRIVCSSGEPPAVARGVFNHWVKWSVEEKRAKLATRLATLHHARRMARPWLAVWWRRGYLHSARKRARLRYEWHLQRRCLGRWCDWVRLMIELKPQRERLELEAGLQLEKVADTFYAETIAKRRVRRLREVFDRIKEESRFSQLQRFAKRLYQRFICRRVMYCLRSYAQWSKQRRRALKLSRHRRRQEEEQAQRDEWNAEQAEFWATVEAHRPENEYKDRFDAQREATELHFRIKANELRVSQRRREQRQAAMNEMLERVSRKQDAIEARTMQQVRDEAIAFLSQKDKATKLFVREGVDELWKLLLSGDPLSKAEVAEQARRRWQLQYEIMDVCRVFVDSETGRKLYPPSEKATRPKEDIVTRDSISAIFTDNFISKRLTLAQGKAEKQRQAAVELEGRNFHASYLQLKWRNYQRRRTMSQALPRFLSEVREQRRIDAEEDQRRRLNAASARIAACWRSMKARVNIRKLFATLYEMKCDPETGAVYYVNSRTGEKAWTQPTIAGRMMKGLLADPDWVYDATARVYISTKFGEKRRRAPPGYHICVACQTDLAARFCRKCGDYYCIPCFSDAHLKGKRAEHTFVAIAVRKVMCKDCARRPATEKCRDCNLEFCGSCGPTRHDKTHPDHVWHDRVAMWE